MGRDVIPGQSFLQLRGQELGFTHNINPRDVATKKETKIDCREKKRSEQGWANPITISDLPSIPDPSELPRQVSDLKPAMNVRKRICYT